MPALASGVDLLMQNGHISIARARGSMHQLFPKLIDRGTRHLASRTGCKAMIRVKKEWDGYFIIKDIVCEHNHRLTLGPEMLPFLHLHKTFDNTILEYVKFLQFKGMSQSQMINIPNGEIQEVC